MVLFIHLRSYLAIPQFLSIVTELVIQPYGVTIGLEAQLLVKMSVKKMQNMVKT